MKFNLLLFIIFIVIVAFPGCISDQTTKCPPIKILITETWAYEDAFPTFIAIDNYLAAKRILATDIDTSIFNEEDTTLSLTERMERLSKKSGISNDVKTQHPLFSLLQPIANSPYYYSWKELVNPITYYACTISSLDEDGLIYNGNARQEKGYVNKYINTKTNAFIGTALTRDTGQINSYLKSEEIREKYLSGFTLHWTPVKDTSVVYLYLTNKSNRFMELDSSNIDYLNYKKNEYNNYPTPDNPVHLLFIKLKTNTINNKKVYVFKINIGDKVFANSIPGSILNDEFPIAEKLTSDDIDKLQECYGNKLKSTLKRL